MSNNGKELYVALARKVAHLDVPEDIIEKTVKRLAVSKEKIRGVDICTHGICLDYFIEKDNPWASIADVVSLDESVIKGVTIFPWGIINPEILHVQVQHEIPELAKFTR